MRRMQPIAVLVLCLSMSVLANAQERTIERTVALEPGGSLSLDTSRGSVRLTTWHEPSVEIRARIEAPRDTDVDHAREIVDATRIDVQAAPARVQVRTDLSNVRQRWNRGRRRTMPRVHYEIRLPRETDLDLDLDRVAATVRGVEGTIALHLDRTDLAANDLSGEIRIDSDRGNIEAVRLHGSLHLDVDRGNAAIRDVRIAGDSRVAIDRGDIDLELVSEQAVTVHVKVSRRARMTSELPGATRHSVRRWSINVGGPELKITADRGHVRLRSN